MSIGETLTSSQKQDQNIFRRIHLDIFFTIREKAPFMPRQTLFLAIAIFDKLCEASQLTQDKLSTNQNQAITRVTACFWLAWKFNQVQKMPLQILFSTMPATDIRIEKVVEMESHILITIDFQIPVEIPYFELTNSFEKEIGKVPNSIALASKCLGFLKQAIIWSRDFSLCADLGKHILTLYTTQRFGDVRVKDVYGLIRRRNTRRVVAEVTVA